MQCRFKFSTTTSNFIDQQLVISHTLKIHKFFELLISIMQGALRFCVCPVTNVLLLSDIKIHFLPGSSSDPRFCFFCFITRLNRYSDITAFFTSEESSYTVAFTISHDRSLQENIEYTLTIPDIDQPGWLASFLSSVRIIEKKITIDGRCVCCARLRRSYKIYLYVEGK